MSVYSSEFNNYELQKSKKIKKIKKQYEKIQMQL